MLLRMIGEIEVSSFLLFLHINPHTTHNSSNRSNEGLTLETSAFKLFSFWWSVSVSRTVSFLFWTTVALLSRALLALSFAGLFREYLTPCLRFSCYGLFRYYLVRFYDLLSMDCYLSIWRFKDSLDCYVLYLTDFKHSFSLDCNVSISRTFRIFFIELLC